MAEQVPAAHPLAESGITVSLQSIGSGDDTRSAQPGHIYVRQGRVIPAVERPSKATRRKVGRPRKRGRRPKAKQGGWRTTRYITSQLRKETRHKARLLMAEGFGFTVFATARGLFGRPDSESKRHVAKEFSRLCEMLGDKGHGYIGLTTYEKINGYLHGHLLLHVQPEQMAVVKAWADRFDETPLRPHEIVEGVRRHARPYAGLSDIQYVLKQHRWCGEHEKKLGFYQKGEPFTGTRVSFTKEARTVIERTEARAAALTERLTVKAKPPALRVIVSNPLVPGPEQLNMFPMAKRPVSRLAQYGGGVMPSAVAQEVEARRHWRGLTQEQLADAIMVARPTLANACRGRFPLSGWAASRLREFLLSQPMLRAA